jgi:hypothetical protein
MKPHIRREDLCKMKRPRQLFRLLPHHSFVVITHASAPASPLSTFLPISLSPCQSSNFVGVSRAQRLHAWEVAGLTCLDDRPGLGGLP